DVDLHQSRLPGRYRQSVVSRSRRRSDSGAGTRGDHGGDLRVDGRPLPRDHPPARPARALTARTMICRASGVEEKLPEWAILDPGEDRSRGARVALVGGEAGVAVLLVELEPGGLIALHSTPEASICHVVKGGGTL